MRKVDLDDIDWMEIQKIHDNGVYWSNLPRVVGLGRTVFERAVKLGYFRKNNHKIIMSPEARKNISIGRKKYLKENPDKHPWKRDSKFKSIPCEQFKVKLIKNNIMFMEEYQPTNDRFYSIDIAFPNKKIGIEINGNQHYERNGRLKKYYVDRNNYFIGIGWKLYDIHYSTTYNEILMDLLINKIRNFSLNQIDFDFYTNEYFNRKKNKNENKCVDCGVIISKKSKRCKKCASQLRVSPIRPIKEILINEIKLNSWVGLGRKYSVSDNTVRKWAKAYDLI